MDIKTVNTSKDKPDQIKTKQSNKVVSSSKAAKTMATSGDDRVTLSSSGLDRNSSLNTAEQTKSMILADARTAVLSIGNVEQDRVSVLLQ